MHNVKKIEAVIPNTPDEIAGFLRDANNYIAYIEDQFLGKLLLQRDELKSKLDIIEAAVKLRREEYLGKHLEEIPKSYQKTVALLTQYVDYQQYPEETKGDNTVLIELRAKLSAVASRITAWQLKKEQYERAISTGTMILAWAKASLKLGGHH